MPTFRYKALGSDGRVQHGAMVAPDERAVIESLRHTGHLPISASVADSRRLLTLPRRFRMPRIRDRISGRDITSLTRECSTLLNADLTVDACLRSIERYSRNSALNRLVSDIHASIRNGKSLSDALAKHPEYFDSHYVALIHSGEVSGTLGPTLDRLAEHRERSESFRRALITSLTYPAILVVVSTISLFVLMSFVVPRFIPLFADAGQSLPLLTKLVFSTSGFLRKAWWLLILAFCAIALYLQHWYSNADNRRRCDHWVLGIPKFGKILQYIEVVRFARTMGSLIANGLPLIASLKLSTRTSGNHAVREMLEKCRTRIEQGGRLGGELARYDRFPGLAIEMIAIGEESGKLDEMLIKIAKSFEEKTETQLKQLLNLIEPVTILLLGGIIAAVIVAILQAMLGLNDLIT
jgi:general secretion pathway protein F